MATKTILITSGTTWVVPDDWTDAGSTIRAVGGGGGSCGALITGTGSSRGGGGGGGGAYAAVVELGLTAGATVFIQIGAAGVAGAGLGTAGTDTWVNKAANSAPTVSSDGVLAKGGSGANTRIGGAGGTSSASVGTTTFSGGTGGSISA